MEMARPLGAEYTKEVFIKDGFLRRMLIGDDANEPLLGCRMVVMDKLPALIDVLQPDDPEGAGRSAMDVPEFVKVLELITELMSDPNWRMRWMAMNSLGKLATLMSVTEFNATFCAEGARFLLFPEDNVALIRTDWCKVCDTIAESFKARGGGEADAARWVQDKIVPVLVDKAGANKNYQRRSVVLYAAQSLGSYLKDTKEWNDTILPAMLTMCEDTQVANLRLLAARALGDVIRENLVSSVEMQKSIKTLMEEKAASDADVDTQDYARICLAHFK